MDPEQIINDPAVVVAQIKLMATSDSHLRNLANDLVGTVHDPETDPVEFAIDSLLGLLIAVEAKNRGMRNTSRKVFNAINGTTQRTGYATYEEWAGPDPLGN